MLRLQVLLLLRRQQHWVAEQQQQQLGRSRLKFGTGTGQRLGCPGC
jgi:hypothetical protein